MFDIDAIDFKNVKNNKNYARVDHCEKIFYTLPTNNRDIIENSMMNRGENYVNDDVVIIFNDRSYMGLPTFFIYVITEDKDYKHTFYY